MLFESAVEEHSVKRMMLSKKELSLLSDRYFLQVIPGQV